MNGFRHSVEYLEAGVRQFPEGALRLTLISMLGLVLLWSCSAKVRSPWETAVALVNFKVSRQPNLHLAWTLIIGELLLGTMLLVGPILPLGLVVPATLVGSATFGVFSVVIGRTLAAGRSFSCTCFGSDEKSLTRTALYRSTALGLISAACAVAGPLGPAPSIQDLALIVCSASGMLGVVLLLSRSREVIELSRSVARGAR